MMLCLINHHSHTERKTVVIVGLLVLLLQEICAFSSKKQLHPLDEYRGHSDNFMDHSDKESKMVGMEANLFDNNFNDQMQGMKGRGQLDGRQQNRLDYSVYETKVNKADSNKESVDDGFDAANSYPHRVGRSVAFSQQGPQVVRREFLRSEPGVEFVYPSQIRDDRMKQYYGYNTPSRFYNMDIEQRNTLPNITEPGRGCRNLRYAIDEDSNPSEPFHVDHHTNSAILKHHRHVGSLAPLARKRRKHITYRLVPINAAEAKNFKTHKRQQLQPEMNNEAGETSTSKTKSSLEEEEDESITEKTKPHKGNQTICPNKVDAGSPQYQVMTNLQKKVNENEQQNATSVTDEMAKKNMLKQIISELEEFKPHPTSNGSSIRDNSPCSIFGSWISEAGGVRFDIAKSATSGCLNVTIATLIPPSKESWLNGSEWNIGGEIPLTDLGVFTLTAIHKTQHRLATFAGQCMRCMGDDLVAGVWSTGRAARDCKDTIVSYGDKPDVFHKEVLHLLRAQKKRELELRENQTSTFKPTTENLKPPSKSWWEY